MKYDFTLKTSFVIDIDFEQIYEYIKDTTKSSDNQEIYNNFNDNVYYYLEELYSVVIQELEENEYTIDNIMDDWYNWLVDNKNFDL